MFGAFSDYFLNLNHFAAPPPTDQANVATTKAPPASKKALANLPMVKVTADDIIEVTNKECLICLEEQNIGSWSCKLPCGHLFHKPCLVDWLEKHCTCPVCRFELETEDNNYETERKKRMKKRKLRLRKDEIQNKSIAQIRELASSLNVNITECLDKMEVVDKLVKSGLIEITECAPPMEMTESDFNQKTVGELRHLLLSFGLSDRNLIEKSEFRDKLKECGRIIFTPGPGSSSSSSYFPVDLMETRSLTPADENVSSIPIEEQRGVGNAHSDLDAVSGKYHTLLSDLQASSLTELKHLCTQYGVSTAGCLYKQDIVDRLVNSNAVHILAADQQLEAKADHLSGLMETDSNECVDCAVEDSSDSKDKDLSGEKSDNLTADEYTATASPSSSSSSGKTNIHNSQYYAESGSIGIPTSQPNDCQNDDRLTLSDTLLFDMSIREIKSIMSAFGVDSAGCLEKSDMIERIKACNRVRMVPN